MDAYTGANAKFLPNRTFTAKLSLLEGVNRIDLYHFGPAHTNGDTIVVFPAKGVAHMGDLFPARATPFIDTSNGGSASAYPDTLAKALTEIRGVNRVITGHAHVPSTYAAGRRQLLSGAPAPRWMTWKDFEEYADFNRDFLAAVRDAITAGKSVDEAVAALKLPERYKDYGMEHAKANVEAIYKELTK
jgi:glyoxylase-like metal-dependent hydrolase (beta-lactamase superfamily II)